MKEFQQQQTLERKEMLEEQDRKKKVFHVMKRDILKEIKRK